MRQHETVPDEAVRRAGQIELVDITPEALRRRLAHGNVYPAHRIDAALGNYFRPGNLTDDPGLLERVVVNLIDNAVRHGRNVDTGEPAVAVRASAHADHVELRVVDHGPGLAQGTVFTPLQRLGDRDATPGVGLGLSVAKGFVEAMGGTIRAEDTPGGGLTVVVSLPACEG